SQINFAIYLLNDKYLGLGLIHSRLYNNIVGCFNLIVINILLDNVDKLTTELIYFTHTHTINLRQVIFGGWICSGHFFKRWILKNYIWRKVPFLCHLLPQRFKQFE